MTLCVYVTLGILITGALIGRRTNQDPSTNSSNWLSHGIAETHCTTVIFYVCCGSFTFVTLLFFGATVSLNQTICSLSVIGSFVFFGISKCLSFITILVQARRCSSRKWQNWYNPLYILGACDALLIAGTYTMAILNRHSLIESDDQCRLRLQPGYSVAILVSDTLIAALFLVLFLLPAFRVSESPEVVSVTRRGPIAAILSFVVSILNYGTLLLLGGSELAWIWLVSCSASVFLLAVVTAWMAKQTSHSCELSPMEQPLADQLFAEQPALEYQRSRTSLSVSPEWARPVESTTASPSRRTSNARDAPGNLSMGSHVASSPTRGTTKLSSSIHTMEMTSSPPIGSKDDLPITRPILDNYGFVSSSTHPSSLFHPYYVKPLPPPPLVTHSTVLRINDISNDATIASVNNGKVKKDNKIREYHYRRRRMALSGNDSSILPISPISFVSNWTAPDIKESISSNKGLTTDLPPFSQVEGQPYSHNRSNHSNPEPNPQILFPSESYAMIRSISEGNRADPNRHICLEGEVVGHSAPGRGDTPTYIIYGTALGSPSHDAEDYTDDFRC